MTSIELDFAVKEELNKRYRLPDGEPEMTEAQTAFLCGLLKLLKPKRILEVGVAGGGTTAIMLQCLQNLEYQYSMYSVDLCEQFYRDKSKKSGWIAEEAKKVIDVKNHKLLLGKSLPYFIDLISSEGKIDFVLLDTAHTMPGEILDFLLVLPYLSENAVICLHDISLNLENMNEALGNATNILYNSVVAEKYLNLDLESKKRNSYPNIGAFRITADTIKYIENVFGALTLTWGIIPDKEELKLYRDFYKKYYDDKMIEMFDRAYEKNKRIEKSTKTRIKEAIRVIVKGRV